MVFLYKKLISISILLAVFLFGNMVIVHAVSELSHTKTISHTHDGITESHTVSTTSEDKEPPHCTQTKIDTNIIQQVRDNADIPDIGKTVVYLYIG